jgi:hypothetical protein
MLWRPKEGGSMRMTLRFSADEIRGVGGMVGAAMMLGGTAHSGVDVEDDDDGDDED